MRCLLNRAEGCLFEACRFWVDNICQLSISDPKEWPQDPKARFKNENVKKDKPEIREMSKFGPGNISD